ncbi:hypothetical protein HPB48_007009 [Haemaphysalis longicornis]|uniref:Uncharacterized protein n=1 Tax=Haemaphysalis longicornis TaxID=44386 RepID=A0A9J6FEZ4_HAELO|nr:hypothetical protein HPB48_007009 [Haemaphysalis longicornis]
MTGCKEHEDLQIATKDSEGTRTLVCKYCNTEMVTDPAKKPYDRIREHLMSSRHKKFKTASKEAETAERLSRRFLICPVDSVRKKLKRTALS